MNSSYTRYLTRNRSVLLDMACGSDLDLRFSYCSLQAQEAGDSTGATVHAYADIPEVNGSLYKYMSVAIVISSYPGLACSCGENKLGYVGVQ